MVGFPFAAGEPLPPLRKGPLTSAHLVRWSAAMQNWEKIHYDERYARDIAKLPGTIINGSLKQHFLAQFLTEAFDGRGWVFRIDYRFTGMDLVGQSLEVQGKVSSVRGIGAYTLVAVDLAIFNIEQARITTAGTGLVVLTSDGILVDAIDPAAIPHPFRIGQDVSSANDDVPQSVRERLGCALETVRSDYDVDLSRLRLFCDAVIDLRPVHFDAAAASEKGYKAVVARPLFPMHGIELLPGKAPLSSDPVASGREGSPSIIGRSLAQLLGVEDRGLLNGGSLVEIQSLAHVGERIMVESRLVSAKVKRGKTGGTMLVVDRINTFRETGGRTLLIHRPTTLFRIGVI